MANFAAKYSIMTQEMVDRFCDSFYIPAEVHPTAPGGDKTITQFRVGKVGVYSRLFDVCGYRIPFTNFFMAVLKYFRVHISQLSPFGAARVSHFEVLTRVLDLSPSVTVFRAFYTRTYSDGLFSFAKRSTSAPSCFPKPPDSIKNWADHFFWVDSCVFPISVPLYTGGVLEKDSAPHLTARQEQTVKLLESHKTPFRRYPECFLCFVGLSPYYPFDENSYPDFECPDGTDMGLLDFIKTVDPQKVQAMEVQKGDDQVKLLESTQHCFMPLVIPAAGGSSSAAVVEIPALTEGGQEDVTEEDAYLELADSDEGTVMVRQSEVDGQITLPLLPVVVVKLLPVWNRVGRQESEGFLDSSARTNLQICTTVESSSVLAVPVDTIAAAITSTGAAATTKLATDVNPDLVSGPFPSWRSRKGLGSAASVSWGGGEVTRGAKTELELRNKLRVKYAARGRLLEEKDLEILKLKSKLVEKKAEAAEVIRLRDQVLSLSEEKSALTAEVSALNIIVTQKDHDISLLNSRATSLASTMDDAKVTCAEARHEITSLASERDRITSEVSFLRAGFQDFKERMEVQQEQQAQELYNCVVELKAHVMDVYGRLEGKFYPTYLTTLVGRRWLLTHGIQLALLKCLKSPEYQGTLGHALGQAVDFALEDVDFPLVSLLKSKKDARIDEVLDSFLLDGPIAGLPEAAYLQPCIEQLSIPIHHASDTTARLGTTAMSLLCMDRPMPVGEVSTSVAHLSVKDYDEEDTDEALGSVVAVLKFETYHF
ncbi:hypothetical protein Tco_0546564 [Tanacetum coccineum]